MRKILAVALMAVAILALTVAPALAEGYNGVSWDGTTWTDGPGEYTRDSGSPSGPHGGYNSTTNKCADCHSTHYAQGSYVLLRANSREAACDFCHVGGGGSSINIQMDNTYDATSVETTDTRGFGTGHTLGYAGNAPADVDPAFSSSEGFACFDCHTPHGNSARVLSTFANPGRAFEPTAKVVQPFLSGGVDGTAAYTGLGYAADGEGLYDLSLVQDDEGTFWGLTANEGNIVLVKNADGKGAMKKPIWPTGRFLLLKNPDVETVGGLEVSDETTDSAASGGDADDITNDGENKMAVSWDDPYGPADAGYGADQDLDYEKAMPWNPLPADGGVAGADAEFGLTNYGLSSVSEFCMDCHDGTGGASTQQANVWYPDTSANTAAGGYALVYSHDAQPRH